MKKITTIIISLLITQGLQNAIAQSWSLTGNAGTNPANHFIGTTDQKAFKIRTNNNVRITVNGTGKVGIGITSPVFKLDVKGGSINTDSVYRIGGNTVLSLKGLENTYVGVNSGSSTSTGLFNTAIGYFSLYSNTTGSGNTAAGYASLSYNTTGNNNTAYGFNSLTNNTADGNTATGYYALTSNTTGISNTAHGSHALYSNITGSLNTATGNGALLWNTTGNDNTASGINALYSNTTGNANTAYGSSALQDNTTGNYNTANGHAALSSNSTGSNNTANGLEALLANTTGSYNTANGRAALYWNRAGNNATAIGNRAMQYANSTTTPFTNYNVAVGYEALRGSGSPPANTGNNNTALGYQTLLENSTGNSNSATGYFALNSNTTGSSNTATGHNAIYLNTTGSYNSALGRNAYFDIDTLDNTSCIGYNAGGNVDADNRVEIGNTSVSVIAGNVGWSQYSDERIKDNVKEDVPGLDFISKLRPVTYNLNIHRENEMIYKDKNKDEAVWDSKYDIEKIKMTGFLAQEVEKAAKETGYNFSGVQKPANPDDLYSLRYSDFVMPLVKSVQELSQDNEELKMQNAELKKVNMEQQKEIDEIKAVLGLQTKSSGLHQQSSDFSFTIIPNPAKETVTIHFANTPGKQLQLILTDAMGREVKSLFISGSEMQINTSEFANGNYMVKLMDGNNLISTQKLFVNK